jgi:chromate transporter
MPGWRVAGVTGGLIGGLLFVIPGALVILALAALYSAYGGVPLAEALFLGIKATVIVIVAQALLRVSGKALKGPLAWGLALGRSSALFVLQLPFPLIVIGAGLIGYLAATPSGAPTPAPRVPLAQTGRTVAIWGRSGSCRWPRSGSSRPAGSWPRWASSSPSSPS